MSAEIRNNVGGNRTQLAEAACTNVVYLAPRRLLQRAGRSRQSLLLVKAIDLLRQCSNCDRQVVQLLRRAEGIRDRIR